jgi:hypothetical protein
MVARPTLGFERGFVQRAEGVYFLMYSSGAAPSGTSKGIAYLHGAEPRSSGQHSTESRNGENGSPMWRGIGTCSSGRVEPVGQSSSLRRVILSASCLALCACSGESSRARTKYVRQQVTEIHKAMALHYVVSGRRCPRNEEWEVLLGDQYPLRGMRGAAERPLDAWGHPFILTCGPGGPVATSLGADGKKGGRGADRDIVVGP